MPEYFWYAIRVLGGKEEKIKKVIEEAFARSKYKSAYKQIHIPSHSLYDIHSPKKGIKKCYFGYLLVQMDLQNDNVVEMLYGIDGVRGFVTPTGFGRTQTPIPLSQTEIDSMLGKADNYKSVHTAFDDAMNEGDQVEIIHGAFQGHTATVQKADKHSKKIEVILQIFKQDTKLELDYNQVKKVLNKT